MQAELAPRPEVAPGVANKPAERPFISLEPAEYRRLLGGYRLDADSSVLLWVMHEGEWFAGGIGILMFRREDNGKIIGFDFGEPGDFNQRPIRFVRYGACGS